jgi:hypothetical protein
MPVANVRTAFIAAAITYMLGNGVVSFYLRRKRRGIRMRRALAGVPFYLFRVSLRAQPPVGPGLKSLALLSDLAFFGAVVLGLIWLGNGGATDV